MSKVLLITGATGRQGGSVIDALISSSDAAKFTIYALTRNPESGSAKRLASKASNIKLVGGNLEEADAIFDSIGEQVWGVYSVQASMGNPPESEERQARALVDSALKHGVKHFVYSSVERGPNTDNEPTIVPHFISKYHNELYLKEKTAQGEMDWTILRPVAFMEGFSQDYMGKVLATVMKIGLTPRTRLPLVATRDIGYFAAQSFLHPIEYKNKPITIAGDDLTFAEMQKIYKEKTGTEIPQTNWIVGWLVLNFVGELKLMFKFFVDPGYAVNIPELKKVHPGLLSFGEWLEKEGRASK